MPVSLLLVFQTRTISDEAPMTPTGITLSSPQSHRAAAVLLGQACGDALGVPYEFGTPPGGATAG